MKHSARATIRRAEIPLLAVIVLYKAATNLLFVPLMQQLWSLTLRFAPMHYLSNNNASDIFSSPAIILCITIIAILTAFWALYEFSVLLHGLDLARKGETIRLPALLRTSLADIRHAFLPQNWLDLVYSAVLIPFTNFFLAYNYITQLAVPEYIMGVIRANSRYYLLYLAAGAALLFLCVSWVLVLPLFVLERKSLWQSVKESFCCIRRRVFRAFLLLLRWNLSVVLRSLLLTAAVAVPLYGIIIAVGLQSTQAMFALSRAALAIEMPFFQFLIDCAITMAQCTILAMLHCRLRESLPSEPEPVQSGKHHRSTGRLLLGASVAGATLLTFALAFCYLALPRDDELLSMLGGVAPVVTAHRGYSAAAPENTLPAFQLAIDQGCEWAELDVQMTSDGVVVVTHDSNLKRCTGKNAKVYDLTYAEVAQLDAGRWFSSRFADTRIPTLEQVLQLCRGRIGLNVEIKPSAATPALEAETVRLLREYGFDSSNCVITSQSYETLHKVKALAPEYPTGYILALGVGNYYDLPDADFFSVETTFITSGMVNAVHLRGKTVSAWTIDREKVATHMLELGVDDLITDKPDMVQDLLARNQQVDDSLIDFRDLLNALLHPEQPADSSDDAEETITDAVEDPEEFVDAA